MKRIVSALTVLVLFAATSIAQNELFEPGKVFLKNGEVLTGYIKTFKVNSGVKHISFKPGLEAEVRKIPIYEFDSVKVRNLLFVSGVILVDSTGINTDFFPTENNISFSVDTGLLQVLFSGRKSLYYYSFRRKDLFYIREGDSLILLQSPGFKFYSNAAENKIQYKGAYNVRHIASYTYAAQKTTFRFQLAEYFKECPVLMQEINSTVYELFSLYNLFKHYYDKCNVNPKYVYKIFKPKIGYGIKFGYVGKYIDFFSDNPGYPYYTEIKYNLSNSYYIGAFFSYIPGGVLGNLTIDFSVAYYQYHSLGYGQWSDQLADYKGYGDMFLRLVDLGINSRVGYGKGGLKYGVLLGFNYELPVSGYDSLTIHKTLNGIETVYQLDGFVDDYSGRSLLIGYYNLNFGFFISRKFISLDLFSGTVFNSGFLAQQQIKEKNYTLMATIRLDLAGMLKNR